MSYHIRAQGDNFIVIEAEPEDPKDRRTERIIAVCGKREDAAAVVNGLYLVAAAVGSPVSARGQH